MSLGRKDKNSKKIVKSSKLSLFVQRKVKIATSNCVECIFVLDHDCCWELKPFWLIYKARISAHAKSTIKLEFEFLILIVWIAVGNEAERFAEKKTGLSVKVRYDSEGLKESLQTGLS